MSSGHWRRHFEDNQRRPLPEVAGALVLLVCDGGRRPTGTPRLTPAGAAS